MAKDNQCDKCTGMCCRYFALPIDTPEDKGDCEDIRWFLCHKDISVFVEDGDWYISIRNKCRHLSEEDHRCRIYDKRPRICRQYRHSKCDYIEGTYDYKLHFTSDKQMQEYMKVKFENNGKAKANRKAGRSRSKAKVRKRK